MSLYEDLRGSSSSGSRKERRSYSFETADDEIERGGRFRSRPPRRSHTSSTSSSSSSSSSKPRKVTRTTQPAPVVDVERTEDFDRPWAPPPSPPQEAYQQEVAHAHLRPHTLQDIAWDLGLRILEIIIQAAAQEVVYYFAVRRLYPPQKHYTQRQTSQQQRSHRAVVRRR